MTDIVLYEKVDRVGLITFNRPAVMNAFDDMTYPRIVESLEEAAHDDVGAVVVTGAGRGFCSGADVRGFQRRIDRGEFQENAGGETGGGGLLLKMLNYPRPIIAAINGPAVGLGATFTLACDLRYMNENAKIGFIFARVGLITEFGSTYLLPKMVGLGNAKKLVFDANPIGADEALRIGLVNEVLPDEGFLEHAMARAQQIAKKPALALARMKEGFHRFLGGDIAEVQRWEGRTLTKEIRPSPEHAEGVRAFLEKREPDFAAARSANRT
ncbi:MAG: enoyl-CoA hydratase-related protein [Dehalococcoidia bacterium]